MIKAFYINILLFAAGLLAMAPLYGIPQNEVEKELSEYIRNRCTLESILNALEGKEGERIYDIGFTPDLPEGCEIVPDSLYGFNVNSEDPYIAFKVKFKGYRFWLQYTAMLGYGTPMAVVVVKSLSY